MIFKDIYWASGFWVPIILMIDTSVPRFSGALQVSGRWGCDGIMVKDALALNSGEPAPSHEKGPRLLLCDARFCLASPPNTWCGLSLCPQSLCLQDHQFSLLTGLLPAPFRNPALPFLLGLRFWITCLVCEDLQFYSPYHFPPLDCPFREDMGSVALWPWQHPAQ